MEHPCFAPPLCYQQLPITTYYFPMQPLQNNCFYLIYPSSAIDHSKEISSTPQSKSVIAQEREDHETGSAVCSFANSQNKIKRSKQRNQSFVHKTRIDQQFQVSLPLKKKGILYKKKNTESNIINQALSFVNSERSRPYLSKLVSADEQKIQWFYRVIAAIKKANKKYANRKYLKRMIEFNDRSEFHRVYLKEKKSLLSLQEMRAILRKLILVFVREYSYLSLTTSAKIYKQTLREHFWRKREIFKFLFGCQIAEQPIPQ